MHNILVLSLRRKLIFIFNEYEIFLHESILASEYGSHNLLTFSIFGAYFDEKVQAWVESPLFTDS